MVKTIFLCFEIHLKDYNRQIETNCAVNLQGWVYQGTFLQSSLFFKKKKFIYFWLHWVLVAAHRLSLVKARRGYSSSQCAGFSLGWLVFVAEHGL